MKINFKPNLLLFVLLLLTTISVITYFILPTEQEVLLENALQASKDNRKELEKVLEHYRQDDEKWEAAEF